MSVVVICSVPVRLAQLLCMFQLKAVSSSSCSVRNVGVPLKITQRKHCDLLRVWRGLRDASEVRCGKREGVRRWACGNESGDG